MQLPEDFYGTFIGKAVTLEKKLVECPHVVCKRHSLRSRMDKGFEDEFKIHNSKFILAYLILNFLSDIVGFETRSCQPLNFKTINPNTT